MNITMRLLEPRDIPIIVSIAQSKGPSGKTTLLYERYLGGQAWGERAVVVAFHRRTEPEEGPPHGSKRYEGTSSADFEGQCLASKVSRRSDGFTPNAFAILTIFISRMLRLPCSMLPI